MSRKKRRILELGICWMGKNLRDENFKLRGEVSDAVKFDVTLEIHLQAYSTLKNSGHASTKVYCHLKYNKKFSCSNIWKVHRKFITVFPTYLTNSHELLDKISIFLQLSNRITSNLD